MTLTAPNETRASGERCRQLNRLQKTLVICFYGGFTVLLLLIVTDVLSRLIPEGVAVRLGYHSEAYLFVLMLSVWLQFIRPVVNARDGWTRWSWTALFSVFWAAVSLWMIISDPNDLPYRIKTLNEATVALVLVIPYVTLRRPLPRLVLLSIPVLIAVTVWGVMTSPEGWIVDQAEAFGFWMLTIIAFDAMDRGILDPSATTNSAVRWAWYAFLALEPVVVSGLGKGAREGGGFLAESLQWLARAHESFVGVLAVSLLFAVVLRRTGCSCANPFEGFPEAGGDNGRSERERLS